MRTGVATPRTIARRAGVMSYGRRFDLNRNETKRTTRFYTERVTRSRNVQRRREERKASGREPPRGAPRGRSCGSRDRHLRHVRRDPARAATARSVLARGNAVRAFSRLAAALSSPALRQHAVTPTVTLSSLHFAHREVCTLYSSEGDYLTRVETLRCLNCFEFISVFYLLLLPQVWLLTITIADVGLADFVGTFVHKLS